MSKVLVSDVAVINKENFNITDVDYINYLDTSSITNNKILGFQKLDIENDKIPSRAKRKVKNDTIVYSSVRPRLCHFGILKDIPKNTVVSTGFITIDAKEEKIDPYYLYYLLTTNDKIEYISNIADTAVSSYPSINPSDIENMEINIIDDLEQQREIVAILKSIDKKIENNNKINEELESMAKTIYDYWFLQFEFPNEEGKPYKSNGGKMVWNEELKREIPEGWEVETLEKNISLVKGISYKSKNIESNEGIPMINLASIDINRNYKPNELKYFKGNYKEEKEVKFNDMLIACTDLTRNADIIGSPVLVDNLYDKYLYSMDLAKLNVVSNKFNKYYLYMTLRTDFYHKYIKGYASGTNVLHLDVNGILWYKVYIPNGYIQNKFGEIIKNIHEKKSQLSKENQELTSLRDFLLPLLMNGQVGFKEEAFA